MRGKGNEKFLNMQNNSTSSVGGRVGFRIWMDILILNLTSWLLIAYMNYSVNIVNFFLTKKMDFHLSKRNLINFAAQT